MRDTRHRHHPALPLASLALVLLALWGCAGAPEQAPAPTAPPPPEAPPVVPVVVDLTLPASQHSATFSAASEMLERGDWMSATGQLEQLPEPALTPDDRVYLTYQRARIAYIRGQQALALDLLTAVDQPGTNPGLHYRTLNLQRHLEQLAGRYLHSARLGDRLLQMAPAADRAALQRDIWRDLQRLPVDRLQQALLEAESPQWQGWLELAIICRANLTRMLRELPGWVAANANHPAALPLPGGLSYLLEPAPPLQRVALLLPLSGQLAPAGTAILDGYLASYYAARASGAASHDILVLDTDKFPSADAAYTAAIAQGAGMVVGPLGKDDVVAISHYPERPVPVLALNRSEEAAAPQPGSSALVQLSLAPEDEAAALAELAYGRGARRALLIRAAGEWGSKVTEALLQRWQALGGTVANSVTYNGREDYSASVRNALDIPASEERGRQVASLLASPIEFTPRRRRDVDVVFLLSENGPQARSIKPLLAFHYAGELPVYSLSSIYNGVPDSRDSDLDGINLVEMPWLLGASPSLRVSIAAGETGGASYTRLNALGADAFLVQSRFRQLQAGPDALLRGNTGLLSMNPLLQIRRELSLATFDGGVIKSQ